jgi:hypothetical protein
MSVVLHGCLLSVVSKEGEMDDCELAWVESESGLLERRSGITASNDRPRLASHHIDSATLRPFNTTDVTRPTSTTPL